MPKITDKQRLDWLSKRLGRVGPVFERNAYIYRVVFEHSNGQHSLRKAIDAAIRSDRKRTPGRRGVS